MKEVTWLEKNPPAKSSLEADSRLPPMAWLPEAVSPGWGLTPSCHTRALGPTRASVCVLTLTLVGRSQDMLVEFPGLSCADTDGLTQGHCHLHVCPQRRR